MEFVLKPELMKSGVTVTAPDLKGTTANLMPTTAPSLAVKMEGNATPFQGVANVVHCSPAHFAYYKIQMY